MEKEKRMRAHEEAIRLVTWYRRPREQAIETFRARLDKNGILTAMQWDGYDTMVAQHFLDIFPAFNQLIDTEENFIKKLEARKEYLLERLVGHNWVNRSTSTMSNLSSDAEFQAHQECVKTLDTILKLTRAVLEEESK